MKTGVSKLRFVLVEVAVSGLGLGGFVRRSRLFGQLPGRNKLKAGGRLLVSAFPEIKFFLSCCGVL